MNPVLLVIVTALALTILIFVSTLLRRPSTTRKAKHALGKSGGTAPTHGSTATFARGAAVEPTAPERTHETDYDPPTEPELPIAADPELPALPSNLFEHRYAGKFARLRGRTERLRSAVPKT